MQALKYQGTATNPIGPPFGRHKATPDSAGAPTQRAAVTILDSNTARFFFATPRGTPAATAQHRARPKDTGFSAKEGDC